jgi:hypothetical protein
VSVPWLTGAGRLALGRQAGAEMHDQSSRALSRAATLLWTYRRAHCASQVPLHYPHYGKSLQALTGKEPDGGVD